MVVALGAWCDYVADSEYCNTPPEVKQSSEKPERRPNASTDTLHFRIEEFATLSDGRRLTLTNDRGWSSRTSGTLSNDPWLHLTAAAVHAAVLTTLLPDDAAETGESLSYARLAASLADFGIVISVEDLRGLPFSVMLSERLEARLSTAGDSF